MNNNKNKTSNKNTKNKKNGFTLIELLVVVLIIGILAAIALPQYWLSVDKSQFSKMMTLASSIEKAARYYYLSTNTWPNKFDDLYLDLAEGYQKSDLTGQAYNYVCGTIDNIYCCIVPPVSNFQLASITCGKSDLSFAYYLSLMHKDKRCLAKNDNNRAIKLCKSLGIPSSWNGNLITPRGHVYGYLNYTLE